MATKCWDDIICKCISFLLRRILPGWCVLVTCGNSCPWLFWSLGWRHSTLWFLSAFPSRLRIPVALSLHSSNKSHLLSMYRNNSSFRRMNNICGGGWWEWAAWENNSECKVCRLQGNVWVSTGLLDGCFQQISGWLVKACTCWWHPEYRRRSLSRRIWHPYFSIFSIWA